MDGFSADGYIIDQNFLTALPYRGGTSDRNGCGWIAAFNFLRTLGHDVPYEAVLRGMDARHRPPFPAATPMRVLRRYLGTQTDFRYIGRKRDVPAAAVTSRAGILRYLEGFMPHFIAYVRVGDRLYRFLNVRDGQEDITLPMEDFLRLHCRWGRVRLIRAD